VCEKPITRDQVEYEIQFAHDGDHPGLDKFHLHLRCFAVWELEQTKSGQWVPLGHGEVSVPHCSRTPPFSIRGPIVTWEPFGRWLRIGARNVWVAPSAFVAGLIPGCRHRLEVPRGPTARWIMTTLTLDAPGGQAVAVAAW
jgi:hypothetical protein